jgi:hypothetical protein
MYKTRESENGMPAMVLLMFLFAPYPFLPIYYTEIGLPVLAVGFAIGYPLIMFVLVGFIKEWQKIDLKGKPAFVLQRTRIEKIKTLHVQKIVYIGLFFFPFLIFLPRLDIWLMFSLFIAFIGNYFSLSLLHPDCSGTCIIIDRYNNGARKELGKMTRKNGDR